MPYKSVDELPANIKKLSATKQRQFLDVWNSAYARCTKSGKDQKACESAAFAQANGVVLGGKSNNSAEFAASVATFELQAASAPVYDDGETVYRPGKLFVAGDYKDKAYSMTATEILAAAEAFTGPLPIDLEHVPTPLDGKLGELVSVEARGDELHGIVALPKWLDSALDERKVSATWDRATKTLAGLALVRNPRVSDAALMAAFAVDEAVHDETDAALEAMRALFADGRHTTPEGQMALQEMHDISARRGAVCKASNTRQPAKMASSHEATALQKIHDLTTEHGSKCSSSVFPPNGYPFFSAGRRQPRKEGRTMSRFDEFMAWLKGDEGTGDTPEQQLAATLSATRTTMSAADKAEFDAMKKRQADLEAENARIRAERIHDQAVTFADTQIRELRAYPAERDAILTEYVQRATDDLLHGTVTFGEGDQKKTTSRVEQMAVLFEARPKHGLTAEQMKDEGLVALMNRSDTDSAGKDKPATKERVEEMIRMTPVGSALLDRPNGNTRHSAS